ncbi:MAG: hypothetical protein MMC23_007002 [Stictis urceolatum]|nr:hypothetical protein [Stictis urceolata]
MATAEPVARPQDRHSRRRPFTAFMKKLANLKNSSESGSGGTGRSKKNSVSKNHPYPASGRVAQNAGSQAGRGHLSFNTPPSGQSFSEGSLVESGTSLPLSHGQHSLAHGNKSTAATISTKAETTHSDAAHSKTGTVNTNGGVVSSHGNGGDGSTFSSPAPSVRSLTTTLTTIQSAAPGNLMAATNNNAAHTNNQHASVQFSHQFPSSPPASAIPPHVTGQTGGGPPTTYSTATANNLLTDNASVLTLASSSKRRRRNSLDTNASVRALAPSSVFGGSRESLPLSILAGGESSAGLAAIHNRPGMPAAERASVYSSSGVAPALSSERNSYYANKQADGASVRSGLMSHGHGRNDSITGSIGGPSSPLASPRENPSTGGVSRRNSGWGEGEGEREEGRDGKGRDREG